jgi:hypothetical protein
MNPKPLLAITFLILPCGISSLQLEPYVNAKARLYAQIAREQPDGTTFHARRWQSIRTEPAMR